MRKRSYWILPVVLALSVSAAAAGVEVIHDEHVDFGAYRTYAWKEGTNAANPQVQAWIMGAVDRELRARGLRKAGPGSADLYVVSHATAQIDWAATGMYVYSVTWEVGILKGDVTASARGTWVVDLIDGASNRAVWRGTAGKTFVDKTLSQVRRKIDKIAKRMFREYPRPPTK